MKEVATILTNQSEFFKYLKSRFTLIHRSNIFFRDFHYGVMGYLAGHGIKIGYGKAEKVAREIASEFEKNGTLKKIDHQSWLLEYPEFALPRPEGAVKA